MNPYKFDVIVIGAGPGGVTAAGCLANAGISVAVIEGAVYAGAENWSGCVYFAESLAAKECFGPEAVAAAPYERRVARRGTLLHNGLDVIGLELSDARAFQNCYTVLRPVYDPYFARLAEAKGAVLISGTSVTSLIRNNGRVVGVETSRGALYADVTFLAEGDASHLVRAEQLERVPRPHFLQGVKAVLSLGAREIEKRFGLGPGEAAAYELLLRNPAIGGRTAKLNIGGFLYTNRDSISIGYVAPLDNVRDNFRGSHDLLYEWMCGLPYLRELIRDSTLSAYGTKIIRSGGWHERPLLVQDGLAIGGAATGLGIDLPFPNFTGPASATGLYFARAVRNILKRGGSFDEKQLSREYVNPLQESACGRNAEYLSRWPAYFGRSRVLFGRTVDMACGTARFLSAGNLADLGRFLRGHILSVKGLREILGDTARATGSLRLWKPIIVSALHPATIGRWIGNCFRKSAVNTQKIAVILNINGKRVDPETLPWPVNSLLGRLSPALLPALEQVYANDGLPLRKKLSDAVRHVLQGLRLTDLVLIPAYAVILFLVAAGTAVIDAFRFYVLKTPVETMLAQPVMAYAEEQKKARDLDRVKPALSLEAKLATNTYRIGAVSHIRTLWPESIPQQPEMARAGLWWVCPARVYGYDAPLFAGRGRVTVNYENCIKCESCWRAAPDRALWGRQTDHKLIYRPESAALMQLLDFLAANPSEYAANKRAHAGITLLDEKLWYLNEAAVRSFRAVLNASVAFRESIRRIPHSADQGRTAWPASLGVRLSERLAKLAVDLANDGRPELAEIIRSEKKALDLRIAEGRFFHALYCCQRIEERIAAWTNEVSGGSLPGKARTETGAKQLSHETVSALFPDRVVKQWEESPMPEAWCEKLRMFISEHQSEPSETIRVLSSVNPALGLIAAHQLEAARILKRAGWTPTAGICAVDGRRLVYETAGNGVHIKGTVNLVPLAASSSLLICANNAAYCVQAGATGVLIKQTPAIGFRAAGLSDIELDTMIQDRRVDMPQSGPVPDAFSYLSIALGAADYLAARVKDHASGRVQFPGQMLDTEGRDGIAKLGAVKALIARVEAWRILLQTIYDFASHSAFRIPYSASAFSSAVHSQLPTPNSELSLLYAALAAKAFGPEPGTMGYDAGQVFGGFAYSEDDLLSRSYRDSSLFSFLAPGYGAAAGLNKALEKRSMDSVLRSFGSLSPVQGEPFGPLAARLQTVTEKCKALPSRSDAALAGEAKAIVIGIHALLVSLEKDLNEGYGDERGAAAVRVLLGLAEDAAQRALLSAARGDVPASAVFPVEPSGALAAPGTDYDAFCRASGEPHRSGRFLVTVFDRSPRFVPEMQLDDPKLRERWAALVAWFRGNCSEKTFDGLSIERFIEKNHRLPHEIIQAAKDNRWLATYIPRSLDGLGWRKAEYYILNSAAGSFGDASIDLLIMASTSIGTTPILLGLQEELPRVREELIPLEQDEQKLGAIGSRLAKMVGTLSTPNPGWIKKEYEAVMKLVDERIRRTRVVKYLAANFLKAFYSAGIAGRRGDFGGFTTNLKHANELFGKIMADVRAALEELPRRERCHQLFLRYLGHGAVSAFALTEPTAGSDSGGVKTTARLFKANLTRLEDGRYSFTTSGQEQGVRYLIDSDRIVLSEDRVAYKTPDDAPQIIHYDKYDYATDLGLRYYIYRGKECPFHDIGQARQTDAGLAYEYYSLTGAKMWITNGSIATQFCLYAQTPEGVTGFMVDRHSEGLKVGADEKKTGQRGSPTNEISIDDLRVPREAVIGYEGHGQVNALETLNVGRCGLAVVSGALMRKLMREANALIPGGPERDSLLGEAAAVLFGSESLAYYLVGLFDRPHESVRMESAIAKYVCSEDIHELITLVERAFGPAGQTEKYLIEKARRDSRILTIYEGTNEVQRFLILKDLIAQAANWPVLSEQQAAEADRTLAVWKNRLRAHVQEAARVLGDSSWTDAMLQPALFPLSEMAGELLRLECVQYRMERLSARPGQPGTNGPDHGSGMLAAGRRAAGRTLARLAHLEEQFLQGWESVKNNTNTAEIVLADAALDALSGTAPDGVAAGAALSAPLRILSIVRPVADLSPRPRVLNGELRELVWQLDPGDAGALSQVLRLKRNNSSQVAIDVLMPGRFEHEPLLRGIAGFPIHAVLRLDADPSADPAAYTEPIRKLEAAHPYDLIVTGGECRDGDRMLGAYLAGRLKRSYQKKETIADKSVSDWQARGLPAVFSIAGSAPALPGMSEMIAGMHVPLVVLKPEPAQRAASIFALPSGTDRAAPVVTDPAQAAGFLKTFAASASSGKAADYTGTLSAGKLWDGGVCGLLQPADRKGNLAVLRACALAADGINKKAIVLIPAPRDQWPQLLGFAEANGCGQAFCVDTRGGRLSEDGQRALLRHVLKAMTSSTIFAGNQWGSALAHAAGESEEEKKIVLCTGVTGITHETSGMLTFSLPAYEDKLVRRYSFDTPSAYVTIAAEADIPAHAKTDGLQAHSLDLEVKTEWIIPLPPVAPPALSEADVIIDLGYGIRDGSGLTLARELKEKLEAMGLAPLFGATRKVTQDLKLLPLDTQIGQTGVRVNARLIIALGISGAPQHVDYIGTRADILCFNKDREAPLMQLNRSRQAPRVHPIPGDLFVTVRELIEQLGQASALGRWPF